MAASNITLNVRGVDRTGGVFAKVARSAKAVGVSIAAAAAAGTYAFGKTVAELGKISDVAQRAGTSAREIMQLSNALGILGVKSAEPEAVAAAFQKMAKQTGESGLGGFKKVIAEISKLPTVAERSAAAMETFGRSGLDFMPVIEAAAKNGTQAIGELVDGMPGISDAAAEAGDKVADAFEIMTQGAKSLWSDAVGAICAELDENFAGGVRAAALKANAYIEYFTKYAWRTITYTVSHFPEVFLEWGEFMSTFFEQLGVLVWNWMKSVARLFAELGKQIWSLLRGKSFDLGAILDATSFGADLDKFSERVGKAWDDMELVPDEAYKDIQDKLEKSLTAAAKTAAAYGQSAVTAVGDGIAREAKKNKDRAEKSAHVVSSSNSWIEGGTYAAITAGLRQSMRRDDVLAATRNNGRILDKIKDGVNRVADSFENVGVFDVGY